jgi:hypothetical protein
MPGKRFTHRLKSLVVIRRQLGLDYGPSSPSCTVYSCSHAWGSTSIPAATYLVLPQQPYRATNKVQLQYRVVTKFQLASLTNVSECRQPAPPSIIPRIDPNRGGQQVSGPQPPSLTARFHLFLTGQPGMSSSTPAMYELGAGSRVFAPCVPTGNLKCPLGRECRAR